jgi:hypothetical protein
VQEQRGHEPAVEAGRHVRRARELFCDLGPSTLDEQRLDFSRDGRMLYAVSPGTAATSDVVTGFSGYGSRRPCTSPTVFAVATPRTSASRPNPAYAPSSNCAP